MKHMFAIRGAEAPPLLAGNLIAELFDAGATRVHLNQADEAVAGAAMAMSTRPEPFVAVLSTWDGDPAALIKAVRLAAPAAAGWLVEEAIPIEPPITGDGERTAAMVNMALLRRPADIPEEHWLDRWKNHHTGIAVETQDTFGYVQNRVLEPLCGDTEDIVALVEEFFHMGAVGDLHVFFGSGGDDEELARRMGVMLDSVKTFGADRNIDVAATSRYTFTAPPKH
jgi:hypothetical protein